MTNNNEIKNIFKNIIDNLQKLKLFVNEKDKRIVLIDVSKQLENLKN